MSRKKWCSLHHKYGVEMSKTSEVIKKLRKDNGLTQAQLGEKIGYSRSYVKDVESGRTEASRSFLVKVSEIFDISVSALLGSNPILRLIDGNRDKEAPFIPFLMGFSKDEVDLIEYQLKDLFKERQAIFIDAAEYRNATQLYNAIAQTDKSKSKAYAEIESMILDDEKEMMIVIKNLAQSKILNKGQCIMDLFQILGASSKGVVSKSCFILVDFPNLLERNLKEFGD